MWLKKLKFKKLQYILMAVMISATSMIFAASVSYVFEVNNFINNFYSKDSMPDICIAAKASAFEKIQSETELVNKIQSYTLYEGNVQTGAIKLNGNAFNSRSFIFPVNDIEDFVFRMELKDSISSKQPEKGEIWIPYTFAVENKVKIGDKITINDKEPFKVSAFCVTPMTATVFTYFIPYFINPNDYINMGASNFELIFINPKDGVDTDSFIVELSEQVGRLMDSNFTRSAVAAGDSTTTNIVGNVFILASLIIFFAAILIMGYIIRNNILNEYKNIGLYKSMGFSYKKTKWIYLKGYLFIGFISAIIGSLLSLPLIRTMSIPATKYLGTFKLSYLSFIMGVLSVIFLTGLMILCLNIILRKINKIKPVEALNAGLNSSVKKLKKSVIKNARSPLAVAVNEIFKYRGSSVITIILISAAFFLTYLFGGILNSISYIDKKTAAYFAVPESDAYIIIDENIDVYEGLKDTEFTKEIILASLEYDKIKINGKILGMEINNQTSFDIKLTGMPYVKGREPKSNKEVALNVGLIKKLGIKINDYIEADFDGNGAKNYLVVGSYTSIGGPQYSVQMTFGVRPFKENMYLCVYLKDKADFASFKKYAEEQFNIFVDKNYIQVQSIAKMVSGIMTPAIKMLIVILMGFSAMIIINMLFINYINGKRSFGILKSLGLSLKYILLKNLFKILILTAAALIIAITSGFIINPLFYKLIVGNNSYVHSSLLVFGLADALIMLVATVTILFIIPVSKIKPKDLMKE